MGKLGPLCISFPISLTRYTRKGIGGDPRLVGKDVAQALGYKDTVNAMKAHVDDEDKRGGGGWRITTPSGDQQMTIINESGLYSLVLSSKL